MSLKVQTFPESKSLQNSNCIDTCLLGLLNSLTSATMLCIFNICCKTWNNIKVDLMYPNVFVNKKKIYTVDAKTDEFNAIM